MEAEVFDETVWATELTEEARELCVQALTSTTREQCRNHAGIDQQRCALSVIAEAGGHSIHDFSYYSAYQHKFYSMSPGSDTFLKGLIPFELRQLIPEWNDCGDSFDTIAKKIKDWEG